MTVITVIIIIIIMMACFQFYKERTYTHTHISVANPYVYDMYNGRMRSPIYCSDRPVLWIAINH
jgi:hypothetical protein